MGLLKRIRMWITAQLRAMARSAAGGRGKASLEWAFWRVVVALLQLVVAVLILFALRAGIQWDKVLGNGVLLFFATSMMGGAIYRVMRGNLNWTVNRRRLRLGLVITVTVLTVAVIGYVGNVLQQHGLLARGVAPAPGRLLPFQVTAAFLATAFAWKVDAP